MDKLETIVEEIRAEYEAKSAVRDKALQGSRTLIRHCANGIRAEMAHQTLSAKGIKNRYLNENVTIEKDGSFKI